MHEISSRPDRASPAPDTVVAGLEFPSWDSPKLALDEQGQIQEEPLPVQLSPGAAILSHDLSNHSALNFGLEDNSEPDALARPLPAEPVPDEGSFSPPRRRAATAVRHERPSPVHAAVDPGDLDRHIQNQQSELPFDEAVRSGERSKSPSGSPPALLPSPPNAASAGLDQYAVSKKRPDLAGAGRQLSSRRPAAYSRVQPNTFHGAEPPLPHQPQAHFYGAPHAEALLVRKSSSRSSQGGRLQSYFLDSFISAGGSATEEVENVLLVGGDGTLDVFRTDRERPAALGHLRGLPGWVIGAKVIPRGGREDPLQSSRPLVALTIYGPLAPRQGQDGPHRTTVEVYSVKARERVATLFATRPMAIPMGATSSPLFAPPAAASLRVDANSRFITVASGLSGELWIFNAGSDTLGQNDDPAPFRCLGKIWTVVQPGSSSRFGQSELESGDAGHAVPSVQGGRSVFSLGHRWLAYVPARPSHTSIQGEVLVDTNSRPPGVSNHTAPPQPQVNCDVESPDGDGILNRVAREMTQEFIKGAKWFGGQSMQAIRSYWNRSSPPEMPLGLAGPSHGRDAYAHQQYPGAQNFPPTHAPTHYQPQSSSELVLVSILDLGRVERGHDSAAQRMNPMATFQAPHGCSFLSFAPGGLHLLTASKNGDVQYIWDVMKIHQEKPSTTSPSSSPKSTGSGSPARRGPYVRQIASFSRMTAANIVDVAWAAPDGERLAILTEKGTVHMFDIQSSALHWPPPRRAIRASSTSSTDDKGAARTNTLYSATGAAGHTVTTAVKMVNNTAQPLLAAARGRRSSSGAGAVAGGSSSAASGYAKGAQGGRVVAQGLSKSLGAASETINTIRSIGENRLHLPTGSFVSTPGCIRWLTGRETGSMGLVGDGVVRIQEVRTKASSTKRGKRQSLAGGQLVQYEVPSLAHRPLSSDADALGMETDAEDGTLMILGFWNIRPRSGEAARGTHHPQHPLSQAEIETNTPYQPFHTDRRVSLFIYEDSSNPGKESDDLDHQHHDDTSFLDFGQDIAAIPVNLGGSTSSEPEDVLGPMENIVQRGTGSEETEQLVITTRRRKRVKDGAVEDGFFEDDCEVLDFASDRV
ncbi:MAG: hypothetical protein M1815_004389 [Lichina confinis]|nr:MAG: hypothetical protein M1815_004389 [Lichina confinis]